MECGHADFVRVLAPANFRPPFYCGEFVKRRPEVFRKEPGILVDWLQQAMQESSKEQQKKGRNTRRRKLARTRKYLFVDAECAGKCLASVAVACYERYCHCYYTADLSLL